MNARLLMLLVLFSLLLVLPALTSVADNRVQHHSARGHHYYRRQQQTSTNSTPYGEVQLGLTAATCRDRDISSAIDYALRYYVHDMNGAAKYILDQITPRKSGRWLVHAQVIARERQGPDWQSLTNSDVFKQTNFYTCFYHDTQTYILVLRLF